MALLELDAVEFMCQSIAAGSKEEATQRLVAVTVFIAFSSATSCLGMKFLKKEDSLISEGHTNSAIGFIFGLLTRDVQIPIL